MNSEYVTLVDERGRTVGTGEKMAVHRAGTLHRAFSVFIFSPQGQMLLQRRADEKYHSGGLWTNACCSHPRPGESVEDAAHRRLREEMGFDCPLQEILQFTYRAEFENGLVEHEYDHVFVGTFEGEPTPDRSEVSAWKWVDPAALQADLREHPGRYTPWFRLVVDDVLRHVSGGRV
jgi:isopentenyl-diphosphate delta-isomerase